MATQMNCGAKMFKNKIILSFLFVISVFFLSTADSRPIAYQTKEIEDYLAKMKNKEFQSEERDEDLKVQDELLIPVREMSSSESLDQNQEEEPADE